MSSNDDLAAAIETNRDEILANRDEIPESVRKYADLHAVYRSLRYFLLAAVISFLTLATLVGFNYRQSLRNAEAPQENQELLCGAYEVMRLELPEACLPDD